MSSPPPAPTSQVLPPMFGWRRLRVVLGTALLLSLIIWPGWKDTYLSLIGRLAAIGLAQLLMFGIFERWPARLPNWLARWALQVAGVALVMFLITPVVYAVVSRHDPQVWYQNKDRMGGFAMMMMLGLLLSPWMAVSALLRQIKGEARNQALAFELERSELERQALDGRMRLLQAQVEPHFLFNTLANVRELVDSGSPQASTVLGNLIAYLRAAVPRLQQSSSIFGQELELVRAYLEVMHMRMPDRLQFVLYADEAALPLHCPPMALLTLVENAVRHGIDPSEEGGRIEIRVVVQDGRCRAQVIDTGVGLRESDEGLGTGLSNLRERLQLTFGKDAQLRLSALAPHGVSAEIEFPARTGSA